MPPNTGMARFNEIMNEVARILLAKVKEMMGRKKWARAFWEERAPIEGGCSSAKLRLVLPDGKTRSDNTPMEGDLLFMEAWSLRDAVFPQKWYGIKLTVYPNGKCETEFNYDANCFNDPTWFDS